MKPAIPAPTPVDVKRQPTSMRSTVLLSLIVCPRGGVARQRHGQGVRRG